ncbi:MAG: restriction endonuclease subunit R [Candidatus Hydrogenedens sp.]|nr:restriction endonuclease subunit R [Candidatus Hydrogenedens sp.]
MISDGEIDFARQLVDAKEEIQRLREENFRLKALLASFSLRPASSLEERPKATHIKPKIESKQASNHEKLALFRSMFRGREDVYALRWESRRGTTGYSPACGNEWHPSLCKKPCTRCDNKKYLPLTNEVLRDHIFGKVTVGIYPLLSDETCFFLAADFDKKGWKKDAKAYLSACADVNVPAALERSRSGNGCHVWIFFERAIPAALARKLGSSILTRCMERRHEIGLDSYDRFFPNQDTMPKGGFGNLIALPLQRFPRENGNSVFVDDELQPRQNQWDFLASLRRMQPEEAERIVAEAAQRGRIIGVRGCSCDDTADDDPWTLPPSRARLDKPITEPLPEAIAIVRSNQLYVPKGGLPAQMLNRLMRLAAFQNPEFYRAQSMRLSVFGKQRVISCCEDFPKHIALPRGLENEIEDLLNGHSVVVNWQDERTSGQELSVSFKGALTPEQESVGRTLLKDDTGVCVAPTGFGKTVLAAWLITERRCNTLILVHRTALLEQWRERLAAFLDIPIKDVGAIGGGKKKPQGGLDIALLQSLQRKGEVSDLVGGYGHVIVDECHHVSAFTFEKILREVRAKYVLGLTATPIRKDGHHPIIVMQCGRVRVRLSMKDSAKQHPFDHIAVLRNTNFSMSPSALKPSIQEIYSALCADASRNRMIIEDIVRCVEQGRSPIVLTERTQHLQILADELTNSIPHVIAMRGGMGKRQRSALLEQLKSIPENEPRVIVATGRYAGEGFDDARLDTLFLAMPISWRGTLQQYVGRLHRSHANKHVVLAYDYIDQYVPVLVRMSEKRIKGYRVMGYSMTNSWTSSPGEKIS